MADDFYRHNSADEDKKIAAAETGNRYFLQYMSPSFDVRTEQVDAATMYIGRALPGTATSGAFWQIQRLTVGATALQLSYADSSVYFDKIWDDRASYTY